MIQNYMGSLKLNDEVSTKEPDAAVLDGVVLTIPGSIAYHRGVKARKQTMDITVERDCGLICFYGPGKAIELMFEIEELRAIMRLFDPARASVAEDE